MTSLARLPQRARLGPRLLSLVLLAACGSRGEGRGQGQDDHAARPRGDERADVAARSRVAATEGTGEEAGEARGASPDPRAGDGALAIDPAAPRFGDVYVIEDQAGDEVERFLGIEIAPVPRPAGAPIGRALVHSAAWAMRPVDEVAPPPWTRATFVGDALCVTTITRARRVHGTLETEEGATRETTFLALSYEGCETNAYGIVGAEVTREELDAARLPRAPAALARLVARRDAPWDGDLMDERITPPRAFVLESARLAIVMAHQRWVVRDGVVVHHHHGRPVAVVTAGPLVLIELDSVSEGWIAPLDDFVPLVDE